MIYNCFLFYTDYYRIDEIKEKGNSGVKFYKLFEDPDEMNCPFSASFNRSIARDCILKVEFDTMNETNVCNFYLGDFDHDGTFKPFIHFDAVFDKVMMRYDDEKNEFLKIY